MTIKKALAAGCLTLLLGTGTTSAAQIPEPVASNVGKYSLGYQGIFAGNVLNGLSARYWINNKVGTELNLCYLKINVSPSSSNNSLLNSNDTGGNGNGSLLLAMAKIMYSPVIKTHSRFYVGLEGGIANGNINSTSENGTEKIDGIYFINPLIGSEFNFSEIPELGFNFEVGYKSNIIQNISIGHTAVSIGAHYYF